MLGIMAVGGDWRKQMAHERDGHFSAIRGIELGRKINGLLGTIDKRCRMVSRLAGRKIPDGFRHLVEGLSLVGDQACSFSQPCEFLVLLGCRRCWLA